MATSDHHPEVTTTQTISGLEALLSGLGMKIPIPPLPAADVLNKPLDIGRSYLADILTSIVGCDLATACNSIQLPNNIYSGDFTINLDVHPLKSVVPGKYVMHGVLRYQACDNAQCFPPKTLPVNFDVKVIREKSSGGHNPAQSPHVHT